MVETVDYYGIHEAGDVKVLVQEAEATIYGRPAWRTFEVSSPRKPPTAIDLGRGSVSAEVLSAFEGELGKVSKDLLRLFLPIPKTDSNVYYISETRLTLVKQLLKLASPNRELLGMLWAREPNYWLRELSDSNIAPLVLAGVGSVSALNLGKVVQAQQLLPRRLILLGPDLMATAPPVVRLKTSNETVNIDSFDLPAIGATYLKNWMRNG